MYEMEIDMMPIITFADRITFSLLWTRSALSAQTRRGAYQPVQETTGDSLK